MAVGPAKRAGYNKLPELFSRVTVEQVAGTGDDALPELSDRGTGGTDVIEMKATHLTFQIPRESRDSSKPDKRRGSPLNENFC